MAEAFPGAAAGPAAALPTAALDAIAAGYQARGGQPGLAYGIVAGGALVHAGGLGERWLGGPAPDENTVFRIASMTKSFTASAVLALRDEGALTLDDPVTDYVPGVRALRLPSADSPALTLRHLLTMTAGFPSDDPWGDRQQGLPLADFAEFLAGGASFAWAPGIRFEYSNLGYAILGLVITAATGQPYPDVVRERLLRPLGMAATGFEETDFAPGRLARGYRRSGGGWEELPFDRCGAFAPMGGIFSCTADLARWVAGFAAAFPPGAETDGGPHPLRRSSRREMQACHAAVPEPPFARPLGDPLGAGAGGYGFGLFTEEHPVWGHLVHHSGGYPGFGSHMRWHPATGTGVIVLANATYAAASPLAARLLEAVLPEAVARRETVLPGEASGTVLPGAAVRRGAVSRGEVAGRETVLPGAGARRGAVSPGEAAVPAPAGPAPAPGAVWPETLTARRDVMALLEAWDDAAAARLFAPNVAQDEPLPERRRRIEVARERLGGLGEQAARPPESETPAHLRWWVRGPGGEALAEIRLSPQRPPRVMTFTLAVPPAADSALAHALAGLVGFLNDGATGWPPDVPVTGALDMDLLRRQARLAGAWAGRCRPGGYRAGNGESSAALQLEGEHARLLLTAEVDAAGTLARAGFLLGPARPPAPAAPAP